MSRTPKQPKRRALKLAKVADILLCKLLLAGSTSGTPFRRQAAPRRAKTRRAMMSSDQEAVLSAASAGGSRRRRVRAPAPTDSADARLAPPISASLVRILDSVFADSPQARADVEFVLASEGFTEPEMWLQLLGSEQ